MITPESIGSTVALVNIITDVMTMKTPDAMKRYSSFFRNMLINFERVSLVNHIPYILGLISSNQTYEDYS
jgi:hypothetical protein